MVALNPLNTELNPICHLLALLGAHHILHVSRIRVNVYGGFCIEFASFPARESFEVAPRFVENLCTPDIKD